MTSSSPPSSSPPSSSPSLLPPLLASVAWLSAFAAGRASGHLHAFLVPTAVLCSVLLLWRQPGLRTRLRGTSAARVAVDIAIGVVTGAVTLALTYALFPIVQGLLPGIDDEIRALYLLAAVSPSTLLATVVIASAEEVIWRGALLDALIARRAADGAAPDAAPGAVGGVVGGVFGGAVVVVVAAVPYALAQLGAGSLLLSLAALGLGVVWGALACWRRSVVAPIVAHLCWTPVVLGLRPLIELS